MSIGYFYMLGCKNPLCNQLSLQSQRLNLWFLTSSMNYRHVHLDWCLISLTMYQYLENSLWVQALVYSWLRMSLPTCCLCWGISASLGYLSFKKFCAVFYVLDRIQQCLFVLCDIFAFSTTSHFSQQEVFHMKRREGDLLDSFSCLLVSRELHECSNKEMDFSGAILVVFVSRCSGSRFRFNWILALSSSGVGFHLNLSVAQLNSVS